MMHCAAVAAAGGGLFFAGRWFWWLAPAYRAVMAIVVLERFTLMLYCTSHRQLFKPRYAALNQVIAWLLGPFFGQTPRCVGALPAAGRRHEPAAPTSRP